MENEIILPADDNVDSSRNVTVPRPMAVKA